MSQGGPNAPLLAALGTTAYRQFSRRPRLDAAASSPRRGEMARDRALPHERPGAGGGEGVRRRGLRSGRGLPRAADEGACRLTG